LELGKSIGLDVGSAAASIIDPGEAKDTLKELVEASEKSRKSGGSSD
jgi:ribosomal protein L7Ae-like RNA K-turn-binding protein